MAHVHWATAARLLPLLLASRTAGPTFLVYRRPRVPSLSTLQHLGRYVRLLEETSARITADHDPAAIRRRSADQAGPSANVGPLSPSRCLPSTGTHRGCDIPSWPVDVPYVPDKIISR